MTTPAVPHPSDAPATQRSWNAALGPLSLAAYLTWVSVALQPLRDAWTAGPAVLGTTRGIGLVAMVVQILLFIAAAQMGRANRLATVRRGVVLLEAVAALTAVWGLLPNGSVPVLLIMVAAQLAPLFPVPATIAAMVAINAVLAALLIGRWSLGEALPALAAYIGFQAFAALTTTYARRAEQARDTLGRINAELVATRRLLLESARSEERLRLSRELHDVAGHKLTALKLQLRVVAAAASDPQRVAIAECASLADQLLADVRGVVDMFRVHDGIDLQAALAALVPSLQRPRVTIDVAPALRVAGLDAAQTLLRCAQEGLTNALRHSDADHVRIRLAAVGSELVLEVEDDGIADAVPVFGNGLLGMSERLAAVDGRLVVTAVEGGGLRLRACLHDR